MQIELDWLKRWAKYSPKNIAVQEAETERGYSYEETYELSQIGAKWLQDKYQIKAGDRVAVLATNEISYVFLFFSVLRLGAILVPINHRLTSREVEYILKDAAPKLVVHQEEYSELLKDLFSSSACALLSGKNSFAQALETYKFENHIEMPEDSKTVCMILYTSGTTGSPKGAMISHEMIYWNSINTGLRLNLCQNDTTVIFLPFFHTGAWNVLTTPFWHRGAKVIFMRKFDADQILLVSEKEKASILFGVPTTMDMMARSKYFKELSLKSIRYAIVGGEPMPLELIRVWSEKNIPIRQGYGLTEFGPNVFSLNEEDSIKKMGSIGFANFYVDTKVVDDNGHIVSQGEVGELCLRGPMCMSGYWNNLKATEETIKDGWLHTGDLVRIDEDSYFYVVGRKKDMFISGGENVYPVEVEKILRSLPKVREAAVIGVPDSKWGEVGKAFVVAESSDLSPDELTEHCLKNLAKFKVPKYFSFVTELPKGDSGKILKRRLTEPPFANL